MKQHVCLGSSEILARLRQGIEFLPVLLARSIDHLEIQGLPDFRSFSFSTTLAMNLLGRLESSPLLPATMIA